MKITDILTGAEKSVEYSEWRKENSDNYLAHIFIMFDGEKLMDRQVGYYNAGRGTMSSFSINDDNVTLIPEAEVLKKPDGSSVNKLEISDVAIDFEAAEEKARTLLKDKYSKEASKRIYILQDIGDGAIWNITLLTNDYSTINIRIDSREGKILKDEIVNIIDFERSG